MRFCDFFISYKILLKGESNFIKWRDLPLYRKVGIVIMFIMAVVLIASATFKNIDGRVPFAILVATMLFLGIMQYICSKKDKMEEMLDKHYKTFSESHMREFCNLLKQYGIDYKNEDELMRLYKQCELELIEYNPFTEIKKAMHILYAAIVPIAVYVAKEYSENMAIGELINQSLQIILIIVYVVVIGYALFPFVRNLLYSDYKKYKNLLYDINQVILFRRKIEEKVDQKQE